MGVAGAAIEHAKLLWAMDKAHRAITNLNAVRCLMQFQDLASSSSLLTEPLPV